jgi:signal peptide peptidase SppA
MSKPQNIMGGGVQAVAPMLIPQNAVELIRIAAAGGVRPKAKHPAAYGGIEARSTGAYCYTAGPLSIVCVDGMMSAGESPLAWLFGGTSTPMLAEEIRRAADDSSTRAMVLKVNSPGGDVAGMSDVVDAVRYAKSKKPVHAIASDTAASSAYWLIALANEIVTTQTGLVGSIGTFCGPLFDESEALGKAGIRVFNARSGENKGAGIPGVPVTPAIEDEYQAIVDSSASVFFAVVSEGRGLSTDQIGALQARVLAGPDALSAGLVNAIVPSADAYIAGLQTKYATGRAAAPGARASASYPKAAAQGVSLMAIDWSNVTDDDLKNAPEAVVNKMKGMYPDKKEEAEPMAATSVQLKASGFSDDFRLKALDAGWTMEQARDQWSTHLAARVATLETEKAELAAKADAKAKAAASVAAAAGSTGGVAPVAAAAGNDDGITEYEQLIRAEMSKNGNHRFKAVHTVNMSRPDLYRNWHAEQVASAARKS